jgi:DNA-binding NtrC family response regulator
VSATVTKWVLIVDDERATAWALAESLRDEGLATEIAHSSGEAEQKCRQRRFDLVITDIRLPDRSGLELLGDLAATPPPPPAIVVSAFGGPEIETAVDRLGAKAYFQKPFDVDMLKSAVTTVLAADSSAN